jgi:uncharacterized repeat protein (TIGR03803 family)
MQILTKFARLFGVLIGTMTIGLATSRVAGAQVPVDVLHGFSIQPIEGPNAVIRATDGNLYGTTSSGGTYDHGTIFKMTPFGTVTILHDFAGCYRDCLRSDGGYPTAALVQATDGNFYGTTTSGGSGGEGTLFKVTPNGVVTVLHSFVCAVDGCELSGALIQATDGNLYGSAYGGGPEFDGSLFKISLDGTFSLLHVFTAADPAGGSPNSPLLQGADGNFYGATNTAIFKMTPDGTVTVLHAFDASEPLFFVGGLVQGTDGNFYGPLGDRNGGGVFKMTPSGSLTVLHQFTGSNGDGGYPGNLLRATDGSIYGATVSGGDGSAFFGHGTVFRLAPDGTVSTLYTFTDGADGAYPFALVQGSDGNFYGTEGDHGSIFRVTTTGALTTIGNVFPGIGEGSPEASLVQAADGSVYGTTTQGGPRHVGTVFRVTYDGVTTVVHSFTGVDGATPHAALVQAPDGSFYGTTGAGGGSNLGTVFRMAPDGTLTVLHAFSGGTDGARPYASMVRGPDGAVYGTTRDGGPLNFGTVFRVAPDGSYTVLYSFAGGYDGGHPLAALVLGTDGNFYGTTSITGAFNAGTAFRITLQGRLTILHAFSGTDGTGRDGSYPRAALLQARDGNFYGTTYAGGTFGYGTMFRMTAEGAVTILHSFAWVDGINPVAPLIQGSDGNLYGTASDGGVGKCVPAGTAFRSTLNGFVTVLYSFSGNIGGYIEPGCFADVIGTHPVDALLQGPDGNMYGTSSQGFYGYGGVFRLRVWPDRPTDAHATITPDRHVQLQWRAVTTATSYTVKRGLAPGQESVVATGLTAPSFTDSSVTKGQRYYYVVSAINDLGESVASSEAAITPGRAQEGDFDGDRTSDITVFRPGTGTWYTVQSGSGTGTVTAWGDSGDLPVPGDYDGDGKTDVAVYRPSTGVWYIISSSTGNGFAYAWGASGDVPVAGDYDGDGKTDIAVYRPSTGAWYVVPSSTGNGFAYMWGASNDIPVAGDYDGDGRTDIAVYRPSTGVWYIVPSRTGNGFAYTWGIGGDIPVAGGDYDGDGKADIAVFRPSTGVWYIVPSSTGNGFAYTWGVSGDAPVLGDYDGDGKTDIAVYRPSTGVWYIVPSSTGNIFAYTWGVSGDLPILKRP